MKPPRRCLAIAMLALGSSVQVAQADDPPVLRTYLNNQCIVADEPYLLPEDADTLSSRSLFAALIVRRLSSAFIQRLVQGGIGRISASAARQNTEYLVAKDVHLYIGDLAASPELALNDQLGCITIVAGQFQPGHFDCTADYQARRISAAMAKRPDHEWVAERSDTSVTNVLRRANICLSEPAQAVYEIRIDYSDDGTAFRLASAGYWIDSLLTSKSRRASRHLVYTLELHEPAKAGNASALLASAWVNVGPVTAGSERTGVADLDRSEWTAVPRLSRDATQAYERDTAVHQEVFHKLKALQRSTARDQRLLDAIRARRQDASPEVQARLDADIADIEYKLLRGQALLEAWQLDYAGLSQAVVAYMPVTVELGITESRSERRARSLLAKFLRYNSELIAATASSRLGVTRSLNFGDEAPSAEQQATARDEYYDALIQLETNPSDETRRLAEQAKANYNEVRADAGVGPIP